MLSVDQAYFALAECLQSTPNGQLDCISNVYFSNSQAGTVNRPAAMS